MQVELIAVATVGAVALAGAGRSDDSGGPNMGATGTGGTKGRGGGGVGGVDPGGTVATLDVGESSIWTMQWKVAAPLPATMAGLDTAASLVSQASRVVGGQ